MANVARFILLFCCAASLASGQSDPADWIVRAGGGIGVGVVAMPKLSDYINVVASSPQQTDEFTSAAELTAFGEVRVLEGWSAGLSWGRVAKTIEPAGSGWLFDASITMPLFFVRRGLDAGAMNVLVTAGAGPASGELRQRFGSIGSEQRYTGRGLALLAGVAAFAPLDDHLLAGVAVDLRSSGIGSLKDANGREPAHRGTAADLRWTQLTLQFLIAAQF